MHIRAADLACGFSVHFGFDILHRWLGARVVKRVLCVGCCIPFVICVCCMLLCLCCVYVMFGCAWLLGVLCMCGHVLCSINCFVFVMRLYSQMC